MLGVLDFRTGLHRSLHLIYRILQYQQDIPQCLTTSAATRPFVDWALSSFRLCASREVPDTWSIHALATCLCEPCRSVAIKAAYVVVMSDRVIGPRAALSKLRSQRPNSMGHPRQAMSTVRHTGQLKNAKSTWSCVSISSERPYFTFDSDQLHISQREDILDVQAFVRSTTAAGR